MAVGASSPNGSATIDAHPSLGGRLSLKDSAGDEITINSSQGLIDISAGSSPQIKIGSSAAIIGADSNLSITFANPNITFQGFSTPSFTFQNHDASKQIVIAPASQKMQVPNYELTTDTGSNAFHGADGAAGTRGKDAIFRGGDSQTAPQFSGGHGGDVIIRTGEHTDNSLGNQGDPGDIIFKGYTSGASSDLQEIGRWEGDNKKLTLGGELEIDGDLNHDGTNWGLAGATPSATQTGYTTFTNLTTDRTCDANSTSVEELADILGTLIEDLKTKGIISA